VAIYKEGVWSSLVLLDLSGRWGPRSGFGMIFVVWGPPFQDIFLDLFSIACCKDAWVSDHM